MRQTDFSETSYGFALTREIMDQLGPDLRAAPWYPTLRKEGSDGGGYDVKFDRPGVPLLIQFKRPDVVESRGAKEFKKHDLPLDVPFFRMPLRTSGESTQHDMLLAHCATKAEVYYAAPVFYTESAFNRLFMKRKVSDNSIFVDPADVGPLSKTAHHLSYVTKYEAWRFSDEPVIMKGDWSKEAMYRKIKVALGQEDTTPASDSLVTFAAASKSLFQNTFDLPLPSDLSPEDLIGQVAQLCRTYLGAELFVAQGSNPPKTPDRPAKARDG
jgi:hypothetical protein